MSPRDELKGPFDARRQDENDDLLMVAIQSEDEDGFERDSLYATGWSS